MWQNKKREEMQKNATKMQKCKKILKKNQKILHFHVKYKQILIEI